MDGKVFKLHTDTLFYQICSNAGSKLGLKSNELGGDEPFHIYFAAMSAFIVQLSEDLIRAIYGDWCTTDDAFRWQLAYVTRGLPEIITNHDHYRIVTRRLRECTVWEVTRMREWTKPWKSMSTIRPWWWREHGDFDYTWMEIMRLAPSFLDFEIYSHPACYPWMRANLRRLRLTDKEFLDPRFPPAPNIVEIAIDISSGEVVPPVVDRIPRWPNVRKLFVTSFGHDSALAIVLHHLSNLIHLHTMFAWYNRYDRFHIPLSVLYRLETLCLENVKLDLPPVSAMTKSFALRVLKIGYNVSAFGLTDTDLWFQTMIFQSPNLHTLHYEKPMPVNCPSLPSIRSFCSNYYDWLANLPSLETFVCTKSVTDPPLIGGTVVIPTTLRSITVRAPMGEISSVQELLEAIDKTRVTVIKT